VALIGEGQQIHVGEETDIDQWSLGLTDDWQIHCAPEQAGHFAKAQPNPAFNLDTALRSHAAKDVQVWVAHLLSGEFEAAAAIMPGLIEQGFDAYFTRNLTAAKDYCRDRYRHQCDRRYGLLASSRARNLTQHGIPNDYLSTKKLNVGAWYLDPPDSPLSCCALDAVATEFSSQGLELDLPIVCWGNDLQWRDSAWGTRTRQKQVHNPLRLRLNSYRVLLTRGRDGLILFIPPELEALIPLMQRSGLRQLA
jgi:DUF2075 family protein